MQTTEYKCKNITPMAMKGANGRELRATPFKSAMRFWWRSLQIEKDGEELLKEEQKIFGGTGGDDDRGRCSFRIRVLQDKTYAENSSHINGKDGIYTQGYQFLVQFTFDKKCDEEYIKKIELLFELLSCIGSVGGKRNAGYGRFDIMKKNDKKYCLYDENNEFKLLQEKININISKGYNASWNKKLSKFEVDKVEKLNKVCEISICKYGIKIGKVLENIGKVSVPYVYVGAMVFEEKVYITNTILNKKIIEEMKHK